VTNALGTVTHQVRNAFMSRNQDGASMYGCDFMTAGTMHTGKRYKRIIVLPLRAFQDSADEQRHLEWFINVYTTLLPEGELIFLSDEDELWFRKNCEREEEEEEEEKEEHGTSASAT
jgi:hypothetical protein